MRPGLAEGSEVGWLIDTAIDIVTIGIIVVGVLSFMIFIYALIRYRRTRQPFALREAPVWLRRIVYLDIAVLLFDLTLLSFNLYAWHEIMIEADDQFLQQKAREEGAGFVRVQVVGRQFFWAFTYPGADEVFGTTDDYTTGNIMIVPENSYVVVDLTAKDVLHSFFIPEFRVKYDAIPGQRTRVWFKTTEPGTYEIACAELCGDKHYDMRAVLRVVSQEEWEAWVARRSNGASGMASGKLHAFGGGEHGQKSFSSLSPGGLVQELAIN